MASQHIRPIHFQTPDQRLITMLPWSDADLSAMSTITQADVKDAAAYWRAHLPPRLKAILDAKPSIPR